MKFSFDCLIQIQTEWFSWPSIDIINNYAEEGDSLMVNNITNPFMQMMKQNINRTHWPMPWVQLQIAAWDFRSTSWHNILHEKNSWKSWSSCILKSISLGPAVKFRPGGVTGAGELLKLRPCEFFWAWCVYHQSGVGTPLPIVQVFRQKYAPCVHVYVPPVVKNWSLGTSS